MTRDPRPAAVEILSRIDRLRRFDPARVAALQAGSDDRDIVERCLEVISEASRHLPATAKAPFPQVNWRGIADIGNVLRHGYDRVSPMLIAQILTYDLDTLEDAVKAILSDLQT